MELLDKRRIHHVYSFFTGLIIFTGLFIVSRHNFLIFHTLAEFFSIVIAWSLFIIVWNTRNIIKQDIFLFIGIACFFIGGLDMLHTISYKGMGILSPEKGANPATQLWIIARYMESVTLFLVPFLFSKRLNQQMIFLIYFAVTSLSICSIFYWDIFPVCYIEGEGLTLFKKVSEYIIILILMAGLVLFYKNRRLMDKSVFRLMSLAIIITMLAELSFTFYISVYGLSNLIGHFFKIISFYLIYKALIDIGLSKPYALLFKNLNEKEKRYRQTFESNQAIKLIIDPQNGDIVEANDAACNYYGYSRKVLSSLKITDINVMPPDKVKEEMNCAKAMDKQAFNFQHKLASGEIRDVEVFSGPVEYDQHKLLYSIIHDVTDQKLAMEALHLSKEKHKAMITNISDVIGILDAKGTILYKSPNIKKWFGWEPEDLIGTDGWETVHPEDIEWVQNEFNDLLKKHKSTKKIEYRYKNKDGSYKWIELTASNLLGNPSINGILMNYKDINLRRQTNENLRKSEEKFRATFRTSPDAINLSHAEDGVYIDINEGFTKIMGYSREDVIGKSSIELNLWNDSKDREKLVSGLKENGLVENLEADLIGKDGQIRTGLMSARLLSIDNQDVILSITRDITEKKQAEKALIESEEKYRTLFERESDAIFIFDPETTNILDANEATSNIYGYSHNELIGMSCLKLSAEVKESVSAIEKISKGNVVDFSINLHCKKDGTVFPVEINGYDITLKGKEVIYAVSKDITKRKQTEDNLLKNQYYLAKAQEIGKIGTWELDIQKNTLIWTDESYKIFGVPRGTELTYEIFLNCIHPDDRDYVYKKWSAALKNEPYDIMHRLIVDDKVKWVRGKADIEFDIEGKALIAIGFTQDLTGHKEIENALHESEKRFKTMFEMGPLSYQSLDENGNFTEVNQTWLETMGYKREEVLGKNFSGFLHPDWKDHFKENFPRFKAVGEVLGVEFEMVKKDGSIILVSFHGKIGKNSDGTFKQTHCIFNDVTSQRKFEEEKEVMGQKMTQLQKVESIGNLAGGIAHDFNNILFPIIGMSEMLMEDLPESSEEYKSVQTILIAGQRASELVKQILSFSRQHEHKLIPTRIERILKEVIKLSRSTIPTDIKISENIQQGCGLVMADPTQMHQVAMNLITNAFHAVEGMNGKIDIALESIDSVKEELPDNLLQLGRYVKLSVSDNGIGMTQDTMKKVFEPYFTTKEKGKGTGLGLAVVYGIVKEHKGEIKVYSEVRKGTTFSIYLPLVNKTKKAVFAEQVSEIETGTERILLVDDEISVVELEGQMLSRLGYRVTEQTTSLDALKMFKANSEIFDLVITDMTMPDMTGDKLAKEILSIKPDIPIIICTGFSERINKEQAEAIGVNGFLMKPVLKSEMAQVVRKVLDETQNL